jgi:hypothetical protein
MGWRGLVWRFGVVCCDEQGQPVQCSLGPVLLGGAEVRWELCAQLVGVYDVFHGGLIRECVEVEAYIYQGLDGAESLPFRARCLLGLGGLDKSVEGVDLEQGVFTSHVHLLQSAFVHDGKLF